MPGTKNVCLRCRRGDNTEISGSASTTFPNADASILQLQLDPVHCVEINVVCNQHDPVVVAVVDPGLKIVVRVEIPAPGLVSCDRGKAAGSAGGRDRTATCAIARSTRVTALAELSGIDVPVRDPSVGCPSYLRPTPSVSRTGKVELHRHGLIAWGARSPAVDESLVTVQNTILATGRSFPYTEVVVANVRRPYVVHGRGECSFDGIRVHDIQGRRAADIASEPYRCIGLPRDLETESVELPSPSNVRARTDDGASDDLSRSSFHLDNRASAVLLSIQKCVEIVAVLNPGKPSSVIVVVLNRHGSFARFEKAKQAIPNERSSKDLTSQHGAISTAPWS